MTPAIEFLACELGAVRLELAPCTRGGYEVQLRADGIDEEAQAATAWAAMDAAATLALASYLARHAAILQQAESQAASARETIAAIDELIAEAE